MDDMNHQEPVPASVPAPPSPSPANVPASGAPSSLTGGLAEEQIWAVLRECYDPEIPVNVVDLGLVYNVAVADAAVRVDMTMTVRGCPMHGYMTNDAKQKLRMSAGSAKTVG